VRGDFINPPALSTSTMVTVLKSGKYRFVWIVLPGKLASLTPPDHNSIRRTDPLAPVLAALIVVHGVVWQEPGAGSHTLTPGPDGGSQG